MYVGHIKPTLRVTETLLMVRGTKQQIMICVTIITLKNSKKAFLTKPGLEEFKHD